MSATIGKVYADAVITDERYKECMALVHEANERIDELRELARAAWKCIHSGLSCSDCRLVAGGCTLESAMRKLGVEVDG